MKTCITCKTAETKSGLCCPTCGSVINIMVIIKKHWDPDELEKLRDTLREDPVLAAHTNAKNRGASVMAKLLWFIIEGARPLKLHPDTFRSKVCDAINDEISGAKSIVKYDREHGENAWMKGVANAMEGWVGQITINKA